MHFFYIGVNKMNPFFTALAKPFTAVVEGVSSYANNRQAIKAKKAERADRILEAKTTAKIERVKRGDKAETDYDMQVLQNSISSIADELMIIWVLAIVTLLFIPVSVCATCSVGAVAGFTVLATVPTWFQLLVVGAFISKLGLRFLFSGRNLFGGIVK
jgi:hypothetical protein